MTQHLHTEAELLSTVSLACLLDRFQTTQPLLEDHLATLRINPRSRSKDGELFVTLAELHLLDEFYERLRLGWALSLLQGLNREFKGV